jgi:hypothetical protein
MMSSGKRTIRVVKREQREVADVAESILSLKTVRQVRREMVQTVASWIEEKRKSVATEPRALPINDVVGQF